MGSPVFRPQLWPPQKSTLSHCLVLEMRASHSLDPFDEHAPVPWCIQGRRRTTQSYLATPYLETDKVDEESLLLKQFDWGKPIVIGETVPLRCGVEDERDFLLKSRPFAHGW